jgi:hypothetical protein
MFRLTTKVLLGGVDFGFGDLNGLPPQLDAAVVFGMAKIILGKEVANA